MKPSGNSEPLRQIGGGLIVFQGGQRHLGFELGTVLFSFVAHGQLLFG